MRDFGMPFANSLDVIMGVSDQGHERREAHGGGHGHAELAEQAARVAAHEGDRDEHGHQNQRGGDHGETDFLGALDGGQHRVLAALDAPHDVLEHDDGVVDHQADGEHCGQQRERVDRVVERQHDDRRRNDRHRDRDRGNQRGAQRAEEQEDDDEHQDQRLGQREHHVLERRGDEDRRCRC